MTMTKLLITEIVQNFKNNVHRFPGTVKIGYLTFLLNKINLLR